MKRQLISSGTTWEDTVGYSRAVRIGNIVEVAGTTATDGDQVIGKDDMYAQSKFIFEKIEKVLQEAGASMQDVVRTRMYVTDITRWEDAGRAHGEFFRDIKPACTLMQVGGFVSPDMLIEIEVTAIINE